MSEAKFSDSPLDLSAYGSLNDLVGVWRRVESQVTFMFVTINISFLLLFSFRCLSTTVIGLQK